MHVVIDVNIWISFCIGKHLDDLPQVIEHPEVRLFACLEFDAELADVVTRPRLQKYIKPRRLQEMYQLLDVYARYERITYHSASFGDVNDNYLLNLCDTVKADYLVTGDIPLLNLGTHNQTKIITYRAFCELLGIKNQ